MSTEHKRLKERQNYYRRSAKDTSSGSKRKQAFYDSQLAAARLALDDMVRIKPRTDPRAHGRQPEASLRESEENNDAD